MDLVRPERRSRVLLVGELPGRPLDQVSTELGVEIVREGPENFAQVDAVIAAGAPPEAVAELRRRFPTQPILAISKRSAEEPERLLLFEAGADSVTPSSGDVVTAHLRALLRRAAWRHPC